MRFLGNLVLNLWDCGGQAAFMENYFASQRDHIFRNVEVLIYVFDVQSQVSGCRCGLLLLLLLLLWVLALRLVLSDRSRHLFVHVSIAITAWHGLSYLFSPCARLPGVSLRQNHKKDIQQFVNCLDAIMENSPDAKASSMA